MLSEATKLHQSYLDELHVLQESCTHEVVSEWSREHLGFGRLSNRDVRMCWNCWKIVEQRLRDGTTPPISIPVLGKVQTR
mgnify:CR=1 FL=1